MVEQKGSNLNRRFALAEVRIKEQEIDGGELSVKFKCYKFSLLRSFIMYED